MKWADPSQKNTLYNDIATFFNIDCFALECSLKNAFIAHLTLSVAIDIFLFLVDNQGMGMTYMQCNHNQIVFRTDRCKCADILYNFGHF